MPSKRPTFLEPKPGTVVSVPPVQQHVAPGPDADALLESLRGIPAKDGAEAFAAIIDACAGTGRFDLYDECVALAHREGLIPPPTFCTRCMEVHSG